MTPEQITGIAVTMADGVMYTVDIPEGERPERGETVGIVYDGGKPVAMTIRGHEYAMMAATQAAGITQEDER